VAQTNPVTGKADGFFFVTPDHDGFTGVVANEGLEKARAYLNQVPGPTALDPLWRMLCKLHTTPTHFFGLSLVDP